MLDCMHSFCIPCDGDQRLCNHNQNNGQCSIEVEADADVIQCDSNCIYVVQEYTSASILCTNSMCIIMHVMHELHGCYNQHKCIYM